MIRLQQLTPEVYYKKSRDFQFIGRLYDFVVNSVKTNSTLLYNVPINDNTDSRFMDLISLTLGFSSKHEYNIKQLTAICSTFLWLLRNKGNIMALQIAGQALLNSAGVNEQFYCTVSGTEVEVYIPNSVTDTNLFKDLLEYILPAGLTCRLIKSSTKQAVSQTQMILKETIPAPSKIITFAEKTGNMTSGIKDEHDKYVADMNIDNFYNTTILAVPVTPKSVDIMYQDTTNTALSEEANNEKENK